MPLRCWFSRQQTLFSAESGIYKKSSIERAVLKNFALFIVKHLCFSLFLIKLQTCLQLYKKEIPTKVFSCEYCEIFNESFFTEPLRRTASESWRPSGLQFNIKETLTQVFSCVIYELFKNIYFEQHLRTTTSESCSFTFLDNSHFWLRLVPML